jgi:UDP-N-acetylglucosamine--N-acetylmuramyl-(pentapeptide) pyrophosphoryl-undecaprenol N-acetylglucosamine transferase
LTGVDGFPLKPPLKVLVAASGTGGHLFPAIATAEQLGDCEIEWLGVPDRLETTLVPKTYPLHMIQFGGIQKRGLASLPVFGRLAGAVLSVHKLLKQGQFHGVFTTGGYIAAPAIIAAKMLGLPTVLHESNAMPGKVTRWLSPWCSAVALGFEAASPYLPKARARICVGTPVRAQFLQTLTSEASLPDLEIPTGVPLIVVVGGSQGAVAVNQLVREAAPAWLDAGAWIMHLTGEVDPDVDTFHHPHYLHRPFYDHIAALLQRATLAVSRAGAGTLTELAVTSTPSILIPYPYAADDHQTYNARVFEKAGAARVFPQSSLSAALLRDQVLEELRSPQRLAAMAAATRSLAVMDSAEQLATLIRQVFTHKP